MNNKRPKNSKTLLQSGLGSHPFGDKVYVTCKLSHKGKIWFVEIDEDCPIAALDTEWAARVKDKWGAKAVTVQDVQAKKLSGIFLLSAGAFLHMDGKLALQIRDANAPSHVGHFTEAASRCGEMPSHTILHALNEHLFLRRLEGKPTQAYPIISRGHPRPLQLDAIDIRRQQLETLGLAKAQVTNPLVAKRDVCADTAYIRMDNHIVETINGDHWLDHKHNTLELRAHYRLNGNAMPDGVKMIDGTGHGRATGFYALEDLEGRPMTPALAHYRERAMLGSDRKPAPLV